MASIGTSLHHTTSGTTTTGSSTSTTSTTSTDSLANQNTFLQLLVAQLQNQDPTQPMDGTTFVTQLATFSNLQANVQSETDLNAIAKQYTGTTPTSTSTSKTGS